jgi:hypothetical protein
LSLGKKGEVGEKPVFGKPRKGPKHDLPEGCCKYMKADPSWMQGSAKKNARKTRRQAVKEDVAQHPDYSFDSFVRRAEKLKDEVPGMVDKARDEEADLDDKKEKAEKEAEKSDKELSSSQEDEGKEEDSKWEVLRKIAKDRLKKEKDEDSSDS